MKAITTAQGNRVIVLNYGKKPIASNQISYIEGEGNYSTINCQDNSKVLTSFTLKMFSQHLLQEDNFFSPRKGLLINLDRLDGIKIKNGYKYIVMKDGTEHPISRRKGKQLIDFINASDFWSVEIRNIA